MHPHLTAVLVADREREFRAAARHGRLAPAGRSRPRARLALVGAVVALVAAGVPAAADSEPAARGIEGSRAIAPWGR